MEEENIGGKNKISIIKGRKQEYEEKMKSMREKSKKMGESEKKKAGKEEKSRCSRYD